MEDHIDFQGFIWSSVPNAREE